MKTSKIYVFDNFDDKNIKHIENIILEDLKNANNLKKICIKIKESKLGKINVSEFSRKKCAKLLLS